MQTFSQEINHLTEALSKAQSAIEGAIEDSKNPFFKSNYADLSSVWRACKKPLTDNKLAVFQTTELVEGRTCLVTTISHASGQWMRGYLPLALKENPTPQEIGSAITYARRYALAAVVGVCPAGDDDDAEQAMGRGQKKETSSFQSDSKINTVQLEYVIKTIGKNTDLEKRILEYNKISSLDQLTEKQLRALKPLLESNRGAK